MNRTKHTPGPWVFRKYSHDEETRKRMREVGMNGDTLALSNDGEAVVMSESGRIAGVACRVEFKRGKGHETVCPQREANAALIAAAPDLLAACQEMVAEAKERNRAAGETVFNPAALQLAEAAIAKAEGQ